MRKILLLFCFSVFFLGCSSLPRHEHLTGSIISVNPDNQATTCLERKKTFIGQKIAVFEELCKRETYQKRWTKDAKIKCENFKIGNAEIIDNSDSHSIILKSVGNFKFSTSYFVKE